MTGRSRLSRAYCLLSAGLGAALLARPQRLWRLIGGPPATATDALVVRVLGARHLAQGLAGLRWPDGALARTAPAVDLVHAASMVGLVRLSPRHRRAAFSSALASVLVASVGVAAMWGSRHD